MKTIKTPKGVHNRPHTGPWYEYYNKEERKARRKLFKAIRHKLLFGIPLTEEELEYQKKMGIDVNSKMSCDGRVTTMKKKWITKNGRPYAHHDTTREIIKKLRKRNGNC